MKSKFLKGIAIAASFAVAMGMAAPKINGAPLFGITVTAKTDPAKDFSYEANDDESVTLTKYNNSMGRNVEIPSEIGGKTVTDIGNAAFGKCKYLRNITFPDSVKSIGEEAFSECKSLTSITVPEGITSIESRTFYRCTGLKSVTIPDSVTSIGWHAFTNCTGLKSAVIPESVRIWNSTFSGCTELTIYGCKGSDASITANSVKIPFKYICEYPPNADGTSEAVHDYAEGICTVCGADEPEYSQN